MGGLKYKDVLKALGGSPKKLQLFLVTTKLSDKLSHLEKNHSPTFVAQKFRMEP